MRKKNPKPVEINASSDEGTSNSPALQTTTEIKLPLKEDKRKRKTWVWVPVVEEEKKEPENIETNSRGRAMRNSMRKATENISASLTRKPTTISSTKETKNVRRREASLINLISSATDEPESHCAVDALVDVPVTTAEEPIKEVKNEPEDDPRREASLTIVTSSATDEPESQCRINVQVTTKEEPIEVENDRGREASLKIVNSSATDEPENHCTVIVPVRTAEERIEEAKNEDENARGREAPVTTSDEPIEEEAKDEVENAHGREASVTTAEEPIEEEAENEDEDAHGREASPINISSSATENEQRSQYLVNIPLKTAEESKEDIEVDVVAVDDDEVPQNDWPAFPEYKKIEENLMLCPDAESKECKSLQCECNPSSKEKKRGMACGEECLNRLLLMECGDECRSGKYCTNKRFQNREYAGLEIFFTGPKGWGLRTKKDISPGQFIIEYMGEIIDSKEVLKRIRRYGKDPNHKHHYLMALRNGALIDATMYGNEARFINHSCEPNAATQKWTVGRQLRIGFFAVRTIHAGEEVTFNYQFERYGKKAQKCFCESPKCTGFIGGTKEDSGVDSNDENRESGDVESDTSLDSSTDEEEKINEGSGISSGLKISSDSKIGSASPSSGLMKKRGRPRKYPSSFASFLDINRSNIARLKGHGKHHHHKHLQRSFVSGDTTIREQSEVNEILLRGPLRNRDQVLEFNRLMVRVDQMESRRRMVDFLLRIDDPNILRLFVTNQGFALIRIWFVLPSFERRALQLQSQIARLLMRLPVTNKNQVDEVCIMSTLKQMLIFELPDRLIIKETLANVIDAVVAGVDGISNNQVAATSGKLGQAQILAREFEALKRLAAQLADKWGKLVDWGFKIPKKLVDSIKESTRDDSKYRPNHERHRHRSDSVRSDDREHINRSSNNRNFDRFNKIEGGSALKPPLHQQPPNWRYQRFQNHYRKFISCPQNNSFAPPQVNFNQCNRHNDHGGEDYWEDEEKRQFEEWKQFQRFPPYGTEPDIFSNPYFAMSVAGMRPPFIPPIHLPHPAQIAAAMFAISGQPPLPVQLPFPPPPPQQQEATMLPPPPPPARPTHVNTQNLSQPSSQATLPPPPPPSQSANTSAYQTLDQQKEQPNDDDNNNKTISAIPTPTKDGFPPPSITSSAIVAADNKSKEIQPINKFINIGPIKKKSKNRTKDEAEKTCNKMDDTRIPDLIMAVCSPEYNKDNVDVDKTQDSNRTIKEELMDEKINISTVEKEVEEQTIFPEQRKASERYKKSSKEVQAEMLQRRLKSLRASLGQKASQSHWPHEGVKNSSRIEAKQSDSKQSEAKTSSSKRTFSTTSSRTNSKSRSASREGRRSHYQNDREVRERRRSGERRSQYFSNRGERRTQRDERYQGRGRRFGNGQNYYRGRRQSFNNRRRFSGGSKRSYAISPERTGQNAEGKLDDGSDCEQRKRSALEEKHIHNSREVGDRLKRGNSGGIKAQLVKKAVEQQQNKVEHENILSVSEQKQRQQVQEVNKAEINTITEKLKTIVQPKSVVKSETDEEVLKMPRKKTDKRLQSIDEDISQSSDDDSSSTMSTSSTSSDSLTTSSSILAEVETKTKTLLASGKRKDSLVLDKNTLNDAHNLSQNDFMQSRVQAFSIAPTIRSIKNEIEANEKETHQSSASVPSKSSRGHFLPLKIASDPEQQKLNAELEQDSSDELDSTDMMQPPQISVSILQDPPKLDAYIHQLKEFVYFMETMRRDMHGPPPLPLGFGANALLAVQQGQQLVNIQTKHQQPSQLPVAIKMQSTSTSTTTLGVKKRTHSNDQTQGNNTSSSSNIPVIKRARIGTVSHNTPSNCSNPPIVLQPYQQSVSKNVVRQSQQHPEQFYIASSGDQPSHSNTPPEDPRISNREPILNTMYDNAFAGQSECSITQRHPQLSLSNVTTIHSASNALINQMSDCQNMENPVSTASGHNAIQSSAADPITVTKVEAAPISEADFPSTSSSAYLNNPSTTTPASANPSTAVQLVTRSGLWLIAKDTDGTPYYYHRDTRETRWDLPPGEELIDLNAAAPCNEDSLQNSLVLQQRRAEFKRQVSALVAKCIESYRKRFFPNPNDYSGFLRKITHKVLDSQEGNKELLFNIQVQKNTRRLVDDYIKHFKVRESGVGHQIPT